MDRIARESRPRHRGRTLLDDPPCTQARSWSGAFGANLLFGCVAVIPLWILWLFALNFPLAALELTQRSPTENDGMLPWLIVLVPLLTAVVAPWLLINAWIRRKSALRAGPYWTVSSAVILIPTAFSMVLTEIL